MSRRIKPKKQPHKPCPLCGCEYTRLEFDCALRSWKQWAAERIKCVAVEGPVDPSGEWKHTLFDLADEIKNGTR